MIHPSQITGFRTLSRRFAPTLVPLFVASALLGSAQSALALNKAVKDFRTAITSADIEAISGMSGSAAAANKYQVAKKFAKYAVQAINAKTSGSNVTATNKQDGIGETVSIIVAELSVNPKLTKLSKIRSKIKGVLQRTFKFAGPLTEQLIQDVVGGAALTISNSTAQAANGAKIQAYLTKNAKKLLGTKANRKVAANITAVNLGLTAGFDKTGAGQAIANAKYEDGNLPDLMNIADPETDKRPG